MEAEENPKPPAPDAQSEPGGAGDLADEPSAPLVRLEKAYGEDVVKRTDKGAPSKEKK